MLGKAKVTPPECPHHIVLRTSNRRIVFTHHDDYRHCLGSIRQWKQTLGIKIYAFCLLSRRIELIVDPGTKYQNLERLMSELAVGQIKYAIRRGARCHKLWQSRYAVRRIQAGNLLPLARQVELSPVRACVVLRPEDYCWSSYQTKIRRAKEKWLDFDPQFFALSQSAEERVSKYREFMHEGLSDLERAILNRAVLHGYLQ